MDKSQRHIPQICKNTEMCMYVNSARIFGDELPGGFCQLFQESL